MTAVIRDEDVAFYRANGYLVVRNALHPAELARVQEATAALIEAAEPGKPDYSFREGVLARIEYVVEKSLPMRALLANPFILRSVEKLMGADLIPTWDAMVMKMPGDGVAVPWHRDAATDFVGATPIFNVDFYLDAATEENCVWAIPGSHRWDKERASDWIAQHRGDWNASVADYQAVPGAVPLTMQPGDVLFHDILVLHGSPRTRAEWLRRVVYYEFRTAMVEAEKGPHTPEYIPLKQAVLLGCLRTRREGYALPDEEAFHYAPPPPFDTVSDDQPPTYRYLHADYWRK